MPEHVVVFGSFMMDLVAHAPRRPDTGETLAGSAFEMRAGGKGFNQAMAARRAGADVSFVGMLGDDMFGGQFRTELTDAGIDTQNVRTCPDQGTGVGLPVILPSGDNSIIIVPRANLHVSADDAEQAIATLQSADVLLLQLEVPSEASVKAAQLARAGGARVILNPAPFQELPLALLANADIVIPNEGEACALLGLGPATDLPLADVAARAAQQLAATVVLTAGAAGVFLAPGPNQPGTPGPGGADAAVVHIPALPVQVVDTVGAGDTFCGNLAARLAAGDDLPTAVRYANAAAGLAVARPGGADCAPVPDDVAAALESAQPVSVSSGVGR